MRRTNVLFAAVFLMQFGGAIATTGVALVAKWRFDASLLTLAAIGVVGWLTYTLVCLLLGFYVSRLRPFPVVVSGIVLYGAVYGLGAISRSSWHLALVFFGGGVGAALVWPMLEALIAEGAEGQRLNRRIGLFNISWSVADSAGAVTAGFLYSVWDRLPLVSVMAVMAVMAATVLAARKRKMDRNEPLPERFGARMLEEHEAVEVNSRYRKAAWVANFVAFGVTGVVRSLFAAPAKDIFRMSAPVFGLAIGTFNALRTLTFVVLREWPNWHYRPKIFLAFNSLLAVGMAGVVAAAFLPTGPAQALVFVSFAATGIGIGMTYYSSIFYAVETEAVAVAKTRIHEAVLGGGGAAAVLASGAVNLLVPNVLGPFVMCAVAVGLGMCVSGAYILKVRSGKNP